VNHRTRETAENAAEKELALRRQRSRWSWWLTGAGVLLLVAGAWFSRRSSVDPALVAIVQRGALTAQLTASGILKPSESITYRSPLAGREAEIIELVAEGTRVNEGDLLVRIDTTDLQREVERARQEVRQLQVDVQVADIERQEAAAMMTSVAEGEGALGVEETRTRLQLAQKKVERLRQEQAQLQPLLARGFITREELKRTVDELEQSEQELALAKKRADVVIGVSHPRDQQRAQLQLAHKEAALENARAKKGEAAARLKQLTDQIEHCRIYARRRGMVVHEEFLNANPRRKIRVGDRVTASQGLVTIPEVNRMVLEASVSEADMHRVRPSQPAAVRVEAFPDLRLTGMVARVGTLARASADRPFDDKRFDLIIDLETTNADLRPEMTARADIVVGAKSEVLLVPVNAVFEQQGSMVCHVVRPFGIETRTVELGESDATMVEVVSGLAEGDRVTLTDPGRAATPATAPNGAASPRRDRAQAKPGAPAERHVLQPR
jgi:HlyD family secretion protein